MVAERSLIHDGDPAVVYAVNCDAGTALSD
jgi:hypothetical protein